MSIYLQDGPQQGKQDIKTTQYIYYLVYSWDHTNRDLSLAAPVVLLPSNVTGHPELILALRIQGIKGVEESPFN